MSLSSIQMERMLDAVSGYCTGSPEAARRSTINHSVERFCRDIGGIRLRLGPVPMNRENGIYFAVAPFGGVVFDIKAVLVNGQPLRIGTYKIFYRDDGRASVSFPFGRRDNDALEMDVLWRPGEHTEQMPESWFNKHFDSIMHGSIAAILSQVGTAWGNPELAKQFSEEYSRDVHDCIYETRTADAPNCRLSAYDPNERWI